MDIFRRPDQVNDVGEITQHYVVVVGRGMEESEIIDILRRILNPFLQRIGCPDGKRSQVNLLFLQQFPEPVILQVLRPQIFKPLFFAGGDVNQDALGNRISDFGKRRQCIVLSYCQKTGRSSGEVEPGAGQTLKRGCRVQDRRLALNRIFHYPCLALSGRGYQAGDRRIPRYRP